MRGRLAIDEHEPRALTPFDAGTAIAVTFVISAILPAFWGGRFGFVGDIAISMAAPIVCAVIVWRKKLPFRDSFSLRSVSLRDLGAPVAVFLIIKNIELGLMATIDVVSRGALSRWGNIYPTASEGLGFGASMFMAAIIAPVSEELAFRGFALNSFVEWNCGWGVVIPSVIFASLHHPVGIPGAFVGGVTFALFALKFRSVLASMVVHSVANAYLVLLDASTKGLPEPSQNLACALIGLVTLIVAIRQRQWLRSLWQDFRSLWKGFREPGEFRPRLKSLLRHWSYIVIMGFVFLTLLSVIIAPYIEL